MPVRPHASRLPVATALGGLLLALYFAAAVKPLSRQAAELDKPLTNVWQSFQATNRAYEACAGLDLANVNQRVGELRAALARLEELQRLLRHRLHLPPEIDARMAEPFQLIDFQNDRSRQAEALMRLAKEKTVACEPAVTNGLPEYSVDLVDPRLLWPRLHFANALLLTAVHCKVAGLKALTQLPTVNHQAGGPAALQLAELPMRLELFGSADAVAQFVTSLPLRGDELATLALAPGLTNKPMFLLDQVLARKHSPERPGDVLLELSVSGWIFAGTGASEPLPR